MEFSILLWSGSQQRVLLFFVYIGDKLNEYVNSHKIYCHHRTQSIASTYVDNKLSTLEKR